MGPESDDESVDLDDLRARLDDTDLIPSQQPLLDNIERRFALLDQAGVSSVADLHQQLRGPKSLEALAEASGVDSDYLVLLNRTVSGFFPKPRAFKDASWLDDTVVSSLTHAGIKNTAQFTEAATNGVPELEKQLHLSSGQLSEVVALCDLSRVQWLSPNFAGALIAAGYRTADAVAEVNPQTLHAATAEANDRSMFYRGNVGLRDIQRVIQAARYVPWTHRN